MRSSSNEQVLNRKYSRKHSPLPLVPKITPHISNISNLKRLFGKIFAARHDTSTKANLRALGAYRQSFISVRAERDQSLLCDYSYCDFDQTDDKSHFKRIWSFWDWIYSEQNCGKSFQISKILKF